MFADNKDRVCRSILCSRVVSDHADNLVVIIKIDTAYAGSCPSECSCIVLVETAAAALASRKKDLTVSVCEHSIEKFISIAHRDCYHTVGTRP